MRHPHEKFIIGEIATIVLAIILTIMALFQGSLLFILLAIYFISLSLFCDGLIAWHTYHQQHGIKQFTRGLLLFLLGTFIFIFL